MLVEPLHSVFERIVRRAFSQRRKMLVKLLKDDWALTEIQNALTSLQLPADVRGEKLSLEQFVALTKILVSA